MVIGGTVTNLNSLKGSTKENSLGLPSFGGRCLIYRNAVVG